MKTLLKIGALVLFSVIFFILPFLTNDQLLKKDWQRQEELEFCNVYGCGLISYITPFQYVKFSLNNMFFREPNPISDEEKMPGYRPDVPEQNR